MHLRYKCDVINKGRLHDVINYTNDDIISSDVISFKKNSVVVRCGVHISGDSGRTVSLSELFP